LAPYFMAEIEPKQGLQVVGEEGVVLQELRALQKIAATAQAGVAEGLAQSEVPSSARQVLEAALQSIREQLDASAAYAILFTEWRESLTDTEYILPPELKDSHQRILSDLQEGRDVTTLPYTGMLLYGVAGTGKSDYARYLKKCLGDKAVVVVGNISHIRNSPQPGMALLNLYRQLELDAAKDGKLRVVVFDEFDKLKNKFARKQTHTVSNSSTSDASSGKRSSSSSSSHTEQRHEVEIDDVGDELFSTFKTVLSGTGTGEGRVKRVFTIANSNQTEIQDTLMRGGRLEAIELKPFGMPYREAGRPDAIFDHDIIHQYESYSRTLPRMLAVLNAAFCRDNQGKNNEHLLRISSELAALFEGLRIGPEREDIYAQNLRYIQALLDYFGVSVDLSDRKTMGDYFVTDKNGRMNRSQNHKFGSEIHQMHGLTCAKVAAFHRENRNLFNDYDSARKTIGQFIFPEIKRIYGFSFQG